MRFKEGDILVFVDAKTNPTLISWIGAKAEFNHYTWVDGKQYAVVRWLDSYNISLKPGRYPVECFEKYEKNSLLEYDIEIMERKLDIMKRALNGEEIQYIPNTGNAKWRTLEDVKNHSWDWHNNSYRIAEIDDYIDWDAISDEYCFMARDHDGHAFIYRQEPEAIGATWISSSGKILDARILTSYKQGNKSWENSLVKRP